MHTFETIIGLLFAAALLSLLARRIGAPYPALLALGGAVAAFVPGTPTLQLPPELALALFIAPVLLDAAYDASVRDLRQNWLPITFLTLAAVGLTTVGVAWTVKQLVPDIPWAAAVALGAIVAPPDAAAATAVLKVVRPPYRILMILQGESLFNDASSLLIYRLAVGAVGAGALSASDVAGPLLLATVGSVALGWGAAFVSSRLMRRLSEAPTAILLQFCGVFGVWLLAEALELSAIITIVVFGIVSARRAGERMGAVVRAPAYAVWETAVFGLNALAFLLVGLQVGPILEGLSAAERRDYAFVALAVLVAVIAIRFGWVMSYNTVVRVKNRLVGPDLPEGVPPPTVASGLLISWAGMRGVVSLAAAYALPENFPYRSLLLVCAFAVVLGTLVIQGFTLGPLLRLLKLSDDGALEREIRQTRLAITRRALHSLDGQDGPEIDVLRAEMRDALAATEADADGDGRADLPQHALRRRVLETKREALSQLRRQGEIGDDAYNQIEEELDRSELALTPVVR